jgi:hypothetical protein
MTADDLALTLFSTDEDLLIRAFGDWETVVPVHQALARAADGVVDGWQLTSGSIDFGAAGVAPGHVVSLYRNAGATERVVDRLVVEAAEGMTLTLRRAGQAAGTGQPPTPTTTDSRTFAVLTLGPQARRAAYDLCQRFSIDPATPLRSPSSLADARQLRDAGTAITLHWAYAGAARQAGDSGDSLWATAKMYAAEREEFLERLQLRWARADALQPSSTKFSMRLSR